MNKSCAEYAPVFKAISDETRLRIIGMLSYERELCACNILEEFSITQPTLSYHMRILSDSGLVNARRDGSWMKYTLNKERADEVLDFLTCIIKENKETKCECEK
jgi:ArsR family transcriptional regulator